MKIPPSLSVLILATSLLVPCSSAYGQAATPAAPSGDQWVSHQMNQPPPDTTDKNALSQEMIDEIKQLYLQAKKDQEAKTTSQANDKKAPRSGPARDTGKK
jgi:hypothetical protein